MQVANLTRIASVLPGDSLEVTELVMAEASCMEEAFKTAGIMLKIAGLYPWIDSQSISGKILPHFDVNNVFSCEATL